MLALIVGLVACRNTDEPEVTVEEFRGSYYVRDLTLVEDEAKVDSLIFSVTNGHTYQMLFYDAPGTEVDFCNCEGNLVNYGTQNVTFTLSDVHGYNCDSLRVPGGVFTSDFVSHGDTVVFEQTRPDSIFRLRVVPL